MGPAAFAERGQPIRKSPTKPGSVLGAAAMMALSRPGLLLASLMAVRLLTNHSTEAWREHSRYTTASGQGRTKDDALCVRGLYARHPAV